jgi:hypothetical protein
LCRPRAACPVSLCPYEAVPTLLALTQCQCVCVCVCMCVCVSLSPISLAIDLLLSVFTDESKHLKRKRLKLNTTRSHALLSDLDADVCSVEVVDADAQQVYNVVQPAHETSTIGPAHSPLAPTSTGASEPVRSQATEEVVCVDDEPSAPVLLPPAAVTPSPARIVRPSPAAAPPSALATHGPAPEFLLTGGSICIVCGRELGDLSLLQREVHRNECLDRQNADWSTQRCTDDTPPCDDGVNAPADGCGNDDVVLDVGEAGELLSVPRYSADLIDLSVEVTVMDDAASACASEPRRAASVDAFQALRRGAAQKWSTASDSAQSPSAPAAAPSPTLDAFTTLMQAARERALTVPAPTATAGGRRWGSGASSKPQQPTGYCPFYKRIPGTPFIVDGFKFACPQLSKHYVLTHFHRYGSAILSLWRCCCCCCCW